MAEVTQAEQLEIETLIDRRGLRAVIESIAETCMLKSAHIIDNWQDIPLARKWDQAGSYLEQVSRSAKLKGPL